MNGQRCWSSTPATAAPRRPAPRRPNRGMSATAACSRRTSPSTSPAAPATGSPVEHVVVLTRDSDTNLTLAERAERPQALQAAAFVSLHFSGRTRPSTAPTSSSRRTASPASRRAGGERCSAASGGDRRGGQRAAAPTSARSPPTGTTPRPRPAWSRWRPWPPPARASTAGRPGIPRPARRRPRRRPSGSGGHGRGADGDPQWVGAQGYGRRTAARPRSTPRGRPELPVDRPGRRGRASGRPGSRGCAAWSIGVPELGAVARSRTPRSASCG